MILDMTTAATALLLLLVLWFTPLMLFMSTTRMRRLEKLNWAFLIAVLTWPAFALYLFRVGDDKHSS